jgi:hypothetical protein
MDRREFGLALAGLAMQANSADATTVYKPVAAPPNDLLPALRRFARLPWPQCVEAALPLLMPIGDAIPLLVDLLTDHDLEMRLFAIDLLKELEPDERTLRALVGALGDPDPLVKIWAVEQVVERSFVAALTI